MKGLSKKKRIAKITKQETKLHFSLYKNHLGMGRFKQAYRNMKRARKAYRS